MTGAANAVLAAAAAVALGGGLVTAGVASMPPRDDAAAMRIGGSLYAAECAGCHGAGLEGGAGRPALGAGGHAWRHADAELAAIIGGGVERAGAQAMPGFAGRLGGGEIGAVIAFLKAGWPPSLRAAQASLAGGRAASRPSDPGWTFPAQCRLPTGRSAAALDARVANRTFRPL